MIGRTLLGAAVALAMAATPAFAQQTPAGEQQPAAKAKPKVKPQQAQMQLYVQGDAAFDPGAAILKPGGRSEIDKLLKTAREGTKRDSRPLTISSVIISGHADRLEPEALSEARARAVWGYLLSQGVSEDVMFWEGQGAKAPVAVTKFCDEKLSQEELAACLQPNRRVVLQIGGSKPGKPPKEKPAQVAEQKAAPEEKPAEQQAAKPKPKGKPQSVLVKLYVQGEDAFDPNAAILKPGGRSEIDKLLTTAREGTKRDPRPLTINSVVISGHGDRLESDPQAISLERAQAVKGYLVSQGVNEDLIFWEGRGAKSPVPVTKFCDEKLPQKELTECLQPNRRVVLEINGSKPPKVAAKKPTQTVEQKPAETAEQKPAQTAEQKPAAEKKPATDKQAAKPKPKAKPQSVLVKLNVQGDSAFDPGAAVLKEGGRSEIDKLLKTAREGTKRDPRPLSINAVVISGHGDRLESGAEELSLARAQAVKDYLVSQGISDKVIFWEGRGAKSPVAVTRFCDDKLPQQELAACLQPNRRVVLEISGSKPPKPAKGSS